MIYKCTGPSGITLYNSDINLIKKDMLLFNLKMGTIQHNDIVLFLEEMEPLKYEVVPSNQFKTGIQLVPRTKILHKDKIGCVLFYIDPYDQDQHDQDQFSIDRDFDLYFSPI